MISFNPAFRYPAFLGSLLLSSFFTSLAWSYQVCEVKGPSQAQPTCLIHFGEGEIELDSHAVRELTQCMEQVNWAREFELIGHADACPQDLQTALTKSGRKIVTSLDSGNSILAETRIDHVSKAITQLRDQRGKPGSTLVFTSNESDHRSTSHDADDRTVELRVRDEQPRCIWNYVFDGSGSMLGAWPRVTGTRYPAGSCFHIIVGDGMHCPTTLEEYHPYGSTYIFTAVSQKFLRSSNVVVLSDFDQKDATLDARKAVEGAVRSGKIKVWAP